MAPPKPFKHEPNGFAVCRRDELDRGSRQPGLHKPLNETGVDGAVALEAFRAAAQDRGVARLEAQPARVGGHVRPAFIDHADHAQGNADARNLEPVRPLP